jgi:hypothetical protein
MSLESLLLNETTESGGEFHVIDFSRLSFEFEVGVNGHEEGVNKSKIIVVRTSTVSRARALTVTPLLPPNCQANFCPDGDTLGIQPSILLRGCRLPQLDRYRGQPV